MRDLNAPLIQAVIQANRLTPEQIRQLESPLPLTFSTDDKFNFARSMIYEAIATKTKIMLCGDYDCDGLCGTSILLLTLRKLNADVGFYIPNRFEEGYGLSTTTVSKALDKGYRLFITVDNGVSAQDALNAIRQGGGRSIVLDHHELAEAVPADCLIHPDFLEEPFRRLCGSGLAHQLSNALIGSDDYITALAGIATIADMMPLWDANRSLVTEAIGILNRNDFKPISALLKQDGAALDEEVLAFQLIPKLNAVGRLADQANVNRVVDYLCSTHPESIRQMAAQIQEINRKRKDINQGMYVKALTMIDDAPVLILKDPEFHEGIVGITAGRLANELRRPVIILHENPERLKGSARAYGAQDLRSVIEPGSAYLSRYGGHAAAAGLELPTKDFEAFRAALINGYQPVEETDLPEEPRIPFEGGLVNLESFRQLKAFGPFGMGFKIPFFLVQKATVNSLREINGGVLYNLRISGQNTSAVYFKEDLDDEVKQAPELSFLCRISVDTYRSKTALKLLIERFL